MYRWVDHTAEVELAIATQTETEVFADSLSALAELMGFAGKPGEAHEHRTVTASAPDRAALLAAWLEELVFLSEAEGFVALELESLQRTADGLRATVAGVLDDPPPLVKAVTYHRLQFEPSGSGYVANVVLDV